MDFETALKELPSGTYFEHFAHTTVEDLCFVCLHELDLHAEGEYFHPLAMRKKYLRFIEKHGHHVAEAQAMYKLGLGKTKRDFPYFDSQ
jgi:hypothetical protein